VTGGEKNQARLSEASEIASKITVFTFELVEYQKKKKKKKERKKRCSRI
jgi:hypothetical protein